MSVATLIGLWVWRELSFDRNHKNFDRIAQVMEQQNVNGSINTVSFIPFPLGRELQNRYPGDFRYLVMSSYGDNHILNHLTTAISKYGRYMDVDAPRLLTLDMVEGSSSGLHDPNSILISASTARSIFGNNDPLDQSLKIDNKLSVKVTGVYRDLPESSTFHNLEFIAPWSLYITSENWIVTANKTNDWASTAFFLYAQIADHATMESVSQKIAKTVDDNASPGDRIYHSKIFLHPMSAWHLWSHWDADGHPDGGEIYFIRLFIIIGVFVLLLASINFMNLSTARSEKRAKEVGIRKTVGSLRSQIIGQFYSESLVVVAISFILSIVLAQAMLPWFSGIMGMTLSIPFSNPVFWLAGFCFTVVTAIIAGSYPALYLSAFKPIKVLKGTFKAGRLASVPRKVLVILQFGISIMLAIGTIVVYHQIQYARERPLGYDTNGVIMTRMRSPDFYGKFGLLRDELKKSGAITAFAESSSPVTDVWTSLNDISWDGRDPGAPVDFASMWATHDFGKTVGWNIKEGRDFSPEVASDSSAVVINEAASKFMGLKHPIGSVVRKGSGADQKQYHVIGVVGDIVMESPYKSVKQMIYFLDYDNVNVILMKLNPAANVHESLSKTEAVFRKYIPAAPFEYQFADADFAAKFASEEGLGKLAGFFSALAIVISCLGLFGLVSFVAEQRTKEIGVRKVMGASVFSLWRLLSKDFILLVIVSLVIAMPLSYGFMQNWLRGYSYRAGISWWIFASAGAGAILITMLTISFQSLKAAMANPVKSLRSE